MSPRLASAITIRPAVRAYRHTFSKACMPSAPSASKNASCGLTPTAYGATASITPQQKRVHASAACARPRAASPESSSGSRSGTGSSPTRSWLRLRSTASASRSPNAVTFVLGDAASSSCTIGFESTARPGETRGAACAAPPKLPLWCGLHAPAAGSALHCLLELAACGELGDGRRGNLDSLSRIPRVDALTSSAPLGRELAESGKRDLAARTENIGDRVEEGVDGLSRVALRDTRLVSDPVHELLLCHISLPW